MSVLQCSRRKCENIMCNRLSDEYGYICELCFDELCNTGATTDIHDFMDESKRGRSIAAARVRYNVEFPVMGGGG